MKNKCVVVSGIIQDGTSGRILIQQRSPQREFGLKWEIPGGKVNQGESLEDALVRELYEELGIVVEVTEFVCIVSWGSPTYGIIPIIFQKCKILYGEPSARDAAAIAWVDPKDIGGYDLIHSNLITVTEVL